MRPDGDPAREAELGRARRIIADPQNGEAAAASTNLQVYVLGGGGKDRKLASGLIDMERIDPDEVDVPAWYEPNPGRAGDLAFVLFTGSGERTLANRITNGRWALSAFGTASSASLSRGDTVYSASPVYHPSALLMSVGGAIAGGSRLAVGSRFEPATFWDEVRRYGVTVVSYTWTMMDEIAEAPPNPGEQHHPVRLFIGSGMPRGLWRRVSERFAPARVLEFYASTEGEAVLVNVTGARPGARAGRCRGAPRSRIAAYDPRRPAPDPRRRRLRDPPAPATTRGCCWPASAPTRSGPGRACCAASSSPATPGWRPATCSAATPTATTGSSTTFPR